MDGWCGPASMGSLSLLATTRCAPPPLSPAADMPSVACSKENVFFCFLFVSV